MNRFHKLTATSIAVCLLTSAGCTQALRLRDNTQALRQAGRRLFTQQKPCAPKNPSVESVASQIDWLEHHIDTYGTVVAKQPDVWGESRLTKYRREIEEQLKDQVNKFSSTLQGSLRRSDQSALALAMTLSAATEGGSDNPVISLIGGDNGVLETPVVDQNAPLALDLSRFSSLQKDAGGEDGKISLEPTVFVDQMKRYLNHLNELRRINEGDDNADSPGYALYLVRVPVSVLPGKRTRKGHGAEITVTVQPHIGEDLLPITFRNLVVNDLVDQLALPITHFVNLPLVKNDDDARVKLRQELQQFKTLLESSDDELAIKMRTDDISLPLVASLKVPATRNRRALLPFPSGHITQVYGFESSGYVAVNALEQLQLLHTSQSPVPNEVIHLTDVQSYLRAEIEAAYDLLSRPDNQHLWHGYCDDILVDAVRNREVDTVSGLRQAFYTEPPIRRERETGTRTTTALAWMIIVESALLNDRLAQDMNELASQKGCFTQVPLGTPFHGPNPPLEAREAFNRYVQCRWPIQVFALDPVTDEQNIAETYSRRRELQLAIAAAVAKGEMSANAAGRFARRLELDMETIKLNRKAVGFSLGNDTFGWRFMPRMQTPRTPTTLQAMAETLGGGPTQDQDMRDRQLEPGIRECVALIVMPSFVPFADFDFRSNWFGLTNPSKKEWTIHDTMKLSRAHQAIHRALSHTNDCGLYRPGDLGRLVRVVEQLDRKMPLQTASVPVPYENTLGGFEMFNAGVTDLGPELSGWYGAPGIVLAKCDRCESCKAKKPDDADAKSGSGGSGPDSEEDEACRCHGTTIFLVGKGFSVHETKVIAGGKCIPEFTLLSREIMQVTIPANANALRFCDERQPRVPCDGGQSGCVEKQFVDVHVATPYGVTNHLLIPVYHSDNPLICRDAPREKGGAGPTGAVKPTDDDVAPQDSPATSPKSPTLDSLPPPPPNGTVEEEGSVLLELGAPKKTPTQNNSQTQFQPREVNVTFNSLRPSRDPHHSD